MLFYQLTCATATIAADAVGIHIDEKTTDTIISVLSPPLSFDSSELRKMKKTHSKILH